MGIYYTKLFYVYIIRANLSDMRKITAGR